MKRSSSRLCSLLVLILSVGALLLAAPTICAAGSVETLRIGALAAGDVGTLWASLIYDIAAQAGGTYASLERIAPDGAVRVYPLAGDIAPEGLSADRSGNLWFAAYATNGNVGRIGRLTPRGGLSEFPLPSAGFEDQQVPSAIAVGPDGLAWFTVDRGVTQDRPSSIGRVTAYGTIAELPAKGRAHRIAVTNSSAVWFDSISGPFAGPWQASLGYLTPAGLMRYYRLPDLGGGALPIGG